MKSGIRSTRLFAAAIICLSVFVFYLPVVAFAQHPPSIKIVDVDLSSKSIIIYGEDFIQGSKSKISSLPEVSLGSDPLEVTSYTNDQINALLPADITDGSYLLEVLAANSKSKYATFDLTIGATGATGAKGDTGAAGPQGPAGVSGCVLASSSNTCPASNICSRYVECTGGRVVMGGGVNMSGYNLFPPVINRSYPGSSTLWQVQVTNNEPFVGITVDVWAVCAYAN